MKIPVLIGQIIYILGYPILRIAIFNSKRSYVLIMCENKVLLTVDWLSARHENRLPGGGVKTGENMDVAACRELKEELGLTILSSQLITLEPKFVNSNKGFKYCVYKLNLDQIPTFKTNKLDVLSYVWVSRQNICNYRLGEESKHALNLIGWL